MLTYTQVAAHVPGTANAALSANTRELARRRMQWIAMVEIFP